MIYCVYSNKYILRTNTNNEHIIPLSLAGSNDFTIPVGKDVNSTLAKVDGEIANEFLIEIMRARYDARGHSNKEVIPTLRSVLDEKPVQVSFGNRPLKVYSPIEKKYLDDSEYVGKEFVSRLRINRLTRLRLIAKIALSAGYFVYRDLFIKNIDHASLRALMWAKDISDIPKAIRMYDQFMPVQEKDKSDVELIKLLCEYLKGSAVIFELFDGNLLIHICIMGMYFGSLNIKGKTRELPNEGLYRLGHVAYIQDGQLRRSSFWQMIYDMNSDLKLLDLTGMPIQT